MSNSLKQLLEANLLRPEIREEEVEEISYNLAEQAILLSTVRHDVSKEVGKNKLLEEQVLKVTLVQIQDARTLMTHIRNLSCAQLAESDKARGQVLKRDLYFRAKIVCDRLIEQRNLLQRIRDILAKPENGLVNLKDLIKHLLTEMQSTLYTMQKEESLIDEQLRLRPAA